MKIDENLSIFFFPELKEINKQGTVPLLARITIKGERSETSLSVRIKPEDWNYETSQVTNTNPGYLDLNGKMTEALAKFKKHYLVLQAQFEEVTPSMLQKAYKGKPVTEILAEKERQERTSVLEAFSIYIARFAEKVKSKKRSNKTLRKWNTTKDKMAAFIQHTFKKADTPLSEIKQFHAEDLYDFLITAEDLSNNSAMKYIRNCRQVFKFAVGRWITVNPWTGFICSYEQPEREILTMPEILKLYYREDLSERLEKVRDTLLFSCFTGLAYQELELLQPSDIIEGNDGYQWVNIIRVKTKARENVPLLPIPESIVLKYKDDMECQICDRLLSVVSNQKYNEYLKDLAKFCGINKNLTSHSGRHTFATTVCLENGVPIETVSRMLGHSSIKMTQIYARITTRKISEDMQDLRERLFTGGGQLKQTAAAALEKIRKINIDRPLIAV